MDLNKILFLQKKLMGLCALCRGMGFYLPIYEEKLRILCLECIDENEFLLEKD